MTLLRAVGEHGRVISYEVREDHLQYAEDNVTEYMGGHPDNWDLRLGDLRDVTVEDTDGPVDRVILDMLAPWECLETVRDLLIPGGVFMTYVATVPQLMKVMEGIRELHCFTEPKAWESLVREWKVEGLATRPEHRMNAHTAFLVWARRLADGTVAPKPQRRARK
jgi:tRNA (adenine57-N1/adenine58-N1)-methyltransferase